MKLERPALDLATAELKNNTAEARQIFIANIISADALDEAYLLEQLVIYEKAAQAAVEGNLNLEEPFEPKSEKWSILQAVFFATTVCTTIGYGNIVPETFEGRLFCILFAIIGIPFTLTVIADYGNIFANSVSVLAKKCKSLSKFKYLFFLMTTGHNDYMKTMTSANFHEFFVAKVIVTRIHHDK